MTKLELFEKELTDGAKLFKALGHPARLAILKYLAETKSCMSGDISEELPLSRTTVNQHLKELKDLNLIKGEIEGVKMNYCLNNNNLRKLKETLESFLDNIGCCDDSKC
jgi:ArsR family transcriptional regulator, arsenate/arsenite/antimonite-responsive transcriptional repressor